MNRLFEIATELGDIAVKANLIIQDNHKFEAAIKKAELELIPEGGWPGSNETQRKIAEATAKASDGPLVYLRDCLDGNQTRLDELYIRRADLLNERQAWEWTIRDMEQQAQGGSSVFALMEKWQERVAYIAANEPG